MLFRSTKVCSSDLIPQSSVSSIILSARDNPCSLLIKTVVEKLNAQFDFDLEEPEEKQTNNNNQTPHTLATDLAIILSDFLEEFSKSRTDANTQQSSNEFLVHAIHAINEAFNETREILSAFGATPERFLEIMDQTYEILMQKMDFVLEGSDTQAA